MKITVYNFMVYDLQKDQIMIQPSKRTAENIDTIGGKLIPASAEEVDKSKLDEWGRYYPEGTR